MPNGTPGRVNGTGKHKIRLGRDQAHAKAVQELLPLGFVLGMLSWFLTWGPSALKATGTKWLLCLWEGLEPSSWQPACAHAGIWIVKVALSLQGPPSRSGPCIRVCRQSKVVRIQLDLGPDFQIASLLQWVYAHSGLEPTGLVAICCRWV